MHTVTNIFKCYDVKLTVKYQHFLNLSNLEFFQNDIHLRPNTETQLKIEVFEIVSNIKTADSF